MWHSHPWQYKKSGVVCEQMTPFFQSVSIPADEFIPGIDMVWSRRKCQAGNGLAVCIGDIFQMLAYRMGVTEVMELLNKTVEQLFMRASSNLAKNNRI